MFLAPSYNIRKKILATTKKIFLGGGVYTMENKDTNTEYQRIVRVGDQKWEIVEFTMGIFFLLLFEIRIQYFL